MSQNLNIVKSVALIGEEISHELGAKMVKDYQDTYANDTTCYQIGRNIIDEILGQPGCVGIRFYNAINELGQKTLVYVGVDQQNNPIYEYTVVSSTGTLSSVRAIVADRSYSPAEEGGQWCWCD